MRASHDVLTINGVTALTTIVQAGATPATGIDRVFDVRGTTATFADVTIRHGLTPAGGLSFTKHGGGIAARAAGGVGVSSVTVTDSVVTDNTATGANGGGIYIEKPFSVAPISNPTLTITGSTISDNTADPAAVEYPVGTAR